MLRAQLVASVHEATGPSNVMPPVLAPQVTSANSTSGAETQQSRSLSRARTLSHPCAWRCQSRSARPELRAPSAQSHRHRATSLSAARHSPPSANPSPRSCLRATRHEAKSVRDSAEKKKGCARVQRVDANSGGVAGFDIHCASDGELARAARAQREAECDTVRLHTQRVRSIA